MNERRRSPAGPATRPAAPPDAATWIPCPTCWGQRRIFEPEPAAGRAGTVLVARACPGCLGIGEVFVGEPLPLPVAATAPEPTAAPPAQERPGAAEPAAPGGRDARRAGAALSCALVAGAGAALVAPPAAALAIAALVGLFCHLCLGGR